MKRACMAVSVGAILLGAAGPAAASGGGVEALGPAPGVCNALVSLSNCVLQSGFVSYHITGSHILHVGQESSATFEYTLPGGNVQTGEGSSSVSLAPPAAMRLIKCTHHLPISSVIGKTKQGSVTCTFKARSITGGWVEDGGVTLAFTGSPDYTLNDFYAVVPKGSAIEGTVREENVADENVDYTDVPGAKVRISGPRGFVKTVTTSGTGYYYAFVPRPGVYTVKPEIPKSYWKGSKPKAPDPTFRKVDVPDNKTVEANFIVKSTLKLEIKLSQHSIPADGTSFVEVTVTSLDAGEPKPDTPFSLRPFGGGSLFQSAWKMQVPATICSASGGQTGGRVWPKPYVTPTTNSVDLQTDSTGTAEFRVYTGTIPGTFPFEVWMETAAGKLITKGVSNVAPEAPIHITALTNGGNPIETLRAYLSNHPGVANTFPTSNVSLVQTLAGLMHDKTIGGFALAPVQATNSQGVVLIKPAGTRFGINPTTGEVLPGLNPQVIAPGNAIGASGLAGGFWGGVQTNTIAYFPTVGQWLSDKADGYSFANIKTPIVLSSGFGPLAYLGLAYLGFGYTGVCT